MKRKLAYPLAVFLLLFLGFATGAVWQDSKNGFHQSLFKEETYNSSFGPICWKHSSETIGFEPMSPSFTAIELGDRTLYKAQGEFQESVPFAKILSVTNNTVIWDDGELRFSLTIDKSPTPRFNRY